MMDVIALTKALIERPSVTPLDHGCQQLLADMLCDKGFSVESLPFNDVQNLVVWHGTGEPTLLFVGHTDVVPPGPIADWAHDPFAAVERDGYLYGRGAADMKSGVAAMTLALMSFVEAYPQHRGRVGMVLTSDEEGPATHGVVKVVEHLKTRGLVPQYVIVGEASSDERVGDAMKIGRRGSMHGTLTIIGKQGHIAYPQKADNPIHRCFLALQALAAEQWDHGNQYFAPTSFQFYDIHAGVDAANVIPGTLTTKFNFRFAPESTPERLQMRVAAILDSFPLQYTVTYDVSSLPYFSGECELSAVCQQAVQDVCGIQCIPNTLGGTSDGRHFAALGSQIIELGPVNKTIHKINECTNMAELRQLERIYSRMLELLFNAQAAR